MAKASIDQLIPHKSLIDLSRKAEGDFDLDDYELSMIFDDIVLVEYIDETADGNEVERNGIIVPTNMMTKAWRKARVILKGPHVVYLNEGDIVVFPNEIGVTISGVTIEGYGRIKKGIFINEERCFGVCKVKEKK